MGLCPAAVPLPITLQSILTVRQFSTASFHAGSSVMPMLPSLKFCTQLAPTHISPSHDEDKSTCKMITLYALGFDTVRFVNLWQHF